MKRLRKPCYLTALPCLILAAFLSCDTQKQDDGIAKSEVATPRVTETAARRAQIQSMYEGYRVEAFAGVADITVAELLAKKESESVVLIDCLPHVIGNSWSTLWIYVLRVSIQRVNDVLESVVGFVSYAPDCRQTGDNDEGQHHSIFNCRGAFFRG